MDNLQYNGCYYEDKTSVYGSFKPYYKWITFNTTQKIAVCKIPSEF